jgi:hypothetical protein
MWGFLLSGFISKFLVEGAIQNPMGSSLRWVVPWHLWRFFLASGFCFLLLLLPFEVEVLFEVEAQPIEVAISWLEEVGWSFGGMVGHCWRFTIRPVIFESFILCWAGCEQVVKGAFPFPSSSFKVGGAFQNPFGLVLYWRVECMPVTFDSFILCLASCILVIGGFLSSWPCLLLWLYLPIFV